MALTEQKRQFIEEEIQLAITALDLAENIKELKARWDLNDFFNQIITQDITDAGHEGVTAGELSNAISALVAIDTALGEFGESPESNKDALIKLI